MVNKWNIIDRMLPAIGRWVFPTDQNFSRISSFVLSLDTVPSQAPSYVPFN